MKKTAIILSAVMALFLAGCASSGNTVLKDETQKTVAQKIKKGKSTKEQVRTIYGDPYTTSFTDSGNEIWKYEFIKAHATASSFIPVVSMFKSGSEGDKKQLVVMFDSRGIVKNFSMSTSKVQYNNGLLQ